VFLRKQSPCYSVLLTRKEVRTREFGKGSTRPEHKENSASAPETSAAVGQRVNQWKFNRRIKDSCGIQ
jgi:hypothetical protein